MNKYLKLIKANTSYARKMEFLSRNIFGEITRPQSLAAAEKIAKKFETLPLHKNPDVVDYYHRLPEIHYLMIHLRSYGLYRDEHEDFKEEMERKRQLRGKGKMPRPKKENPTIEQMYPSLFIK